MTHANRTGGFRLFFLLIKSHPPIVLSQLKDTRRERTSGNLVKLSGVFLDTQNSRQVRKSHTTYRIHVERGGGDSGGNHLKTLNNR